MNEPLPRRLRDYNGPITKAARWASFRHRPDDVFICAPAKHGTTWLQAISAMLIFGRADIAVAPGKISPWIDANFEPVEKTMAMLEAQTHRRFLKTHTPLDGIPFFPECQYLVIYRDPRDALFSLLQLSEKVGSTNARLPVDIHANYKAWVAAPFVPGRAEQPTLAATVHHLLGFWNRRHLPNIHLFHYADLRRDPASGVRAVASAIGIAPSDALVAEIAQATSFANMQKNAALFAPAAGKDGWKSQSGFFRMGAMGQWRTLLTPQEIGAYQAAVARLLPPDIAAWLEHGAAAL